MRVTQFQIKRNPQFPRWEVYGTKSVVRAKRLQPVFVSESIKACCQYVKAVNYESRNFGN